MIFDIQTQVSLQADSFSAAVVVVVSIFHLVS